MLVLRRIEFNDLELWSLKFPHASFQQSAAMARLREQLGWDIHALAGYRDETIECIILLAGKRGRYEIVMGPLYDFNSLQDTLEFTQALRRYVRKINGGIIEIYPAMLYQKRDSNGNVIGEPNADPINYLKSAGWRHKGYSVTYDTVCNRWMYVKSLSGLHSDDDLLRSYRQTTRQTIKKLVVDRYSIKKLSYDELIISKRLVDSSCDKNNIAKRPLSYYQALYASFGESIDFLVVYYDETPISTGVFIRHPQEMVYFMSGADSAYRSLFGGHLLQHTMMSRCIELGIERYNFYGISGQIKNDPLLTYKAGFRGEIEEYIGGFRLIVNPLRYGFYMVRNRAGVVVRRLQF